MADPENRKRNDRAVEAARWLYETQQAQLCEDPNRHRDTIASTRDAAEKFGVPKSTVARQLVKLKKPKAHVARPSRLTEVEEHMLSFHIFMLRRDKKRVNRNIVSDAANVILSLRDPPDLQPISDSFVRRWLQLDHAKRMSSANDPPPVEQPGETEVAGDNDDCSNHDAPGDCEMEMDSENLDRLIDEVYLNPEPSSQWEPDS